MALLCSCAPLESGVQQEVTVTGADHCSGFGSSYSQDGVKIISAQTIAAVPAGDPGLKTEPPIYSSLPAYCRVDGIINERRGANGKTFGIRFAVALPQNWNGRFLLQGGGGLNGFVRMPVGAYAARDLPALARGFAVASHDSGHEGAVFDGSFQADQRAAQDFALQAVPDVTRTAKEVIRRFYGTKIDHSYMAGCSTGGREGMLAAQRFPELFDGIIIGAPAMRPGHSNLALSAAAVAFNQAAPRDDKGLPLVEKSFSSSDRALILKELLAQCDALDGLSDGIIMNTAQCRFRPEKLTCRGAKQTDCLSAAQVTAIKTAFTGPKDSTGRPVYSAYPFDTGIVDDKARIPGFLPTGLPGPFGPATRDLSIDIDARLDRIRADAMRQATDTHTWTNFSTFLDRGGKILFFHGVSDPWFSAFDTLDFWQRAEADNGSRWTESSQFYLVPGMGHCSGGNAYEDFDLLTSLVDWVETNKAPGTIIARRPPPLDDERPLCPYPNYAHYIGGPTNRAQSFVCRPPGY